MPETTVDVDVLYAALDKQRESLGLSWRDVATELQLSASTFSRMAQGRRPDVDTFATLLHWLGMGADAFTHSSSAESRSTEPLAMISTYLRASKDVPKEDIEAFEDIIAAAYRRLIKHHS